MKLPRDWKADSWRRRRVDDDFELAVFAEDERFFWACFVQGSQVSSGWEDTLEAAIEATEREKTRHECK